MKILVLFLLAVMCYGDPIVKNGKNNVQCGSPAIKPDLSQNANIEGGKDVVPFSWPWQVAIVDKKTGALICGGSLISPTWVLTSVHNTEDQDVNNLEVRLGVFNISQDEPGSLRVGVTQKLAHPKYDQGSLDYDIGLLSLANTVQYTDHISPVCIPQTQDEPVPADGTGIYTTGWGYLSIHGPASSTLQQVYQPIATQECKKEYKSILTETMFCGGYKDGGKGFCSFDMGGPTVLEDPPNSGIFKQVGIDTETPIQLGKECVKDYSIYNRVSAGIDFIKQHVTDL